MSITFTEKKVTTCPCGKGQIEATFEISSFKPRVYSPIIKCDTCAQQYKASVGLVNGLPTVVVLIPLNSQFKQILLDNSSFRKVVVELSSNNLDEIISQHNAVLKTKINSANVDVILNDSLGEIWEQYQYLIYRMQTAATPETEFRMAKLLRSAADQYFNQSTAPLEVQVRGKNRYYAPALDYAIRSVEHGYEPALLLEKSLVCYPSEDVQIDLELAKALLLKAAQFRDEDAIFELAKEYSDKHSKLFPYNTQLAAEYYNTLIQKGNNKYYPEYISLLLESNQIKKCKMAIATAIANKDGNLDIEIYKKLYRSGFEKLNDIDLEIDLLSNAASCGITRANEAIKTLYKKPLFGTMMHKKAWMNGKTVREYLG